MALETATYIDQLVNTYPPGTDNLSTADDHLRLIKSVLQNQFTALGLNAVTTTALEINLLAGYAGSAIPDYTIVGSWTQQQYFAQATLTDGAAISWNLNTAQNAQVTLAGNRTLNNPTNKQNGAAYTLVIVQDGVGSRTLAFGTDYKFPGGITPTLSTAANAVDILSCTVHNSLMYCTLTQGFA